MPIHDHSPNPRGKAFMWGGIGLGLLLLVALFTHGFGLLGKKEKAAETAMFTRQGNKIVIPQGSPLRERLTIEAARQDEVVPKLALPGVVESDPARTAAVLPALGGRVLELKVALGDRVAKGQVLAVVDSPDLAQAYDDYDKAADAFELTRKNLTRQEGQHKIGAASERDLDQAKSDFAQAQAEYTRTQARMKVLQIPVESTQRARLLDVRAPVAGSVSSLAIAPGNMINDPTQPIMTIADLSTVWVTALVPEKDLSVVSKNQDAEVTLAAYPDRVLHGKVLFIADVLEPDSRRSRIRIAFHNADYALKPNMFASVVIAGAKQSRVVLPSSALLMNNDRTSVFVETAPWTLERRTVEPLLEEGQSVTIAAGIKPGERVAIKGGVLLND